MSSLGTAKAGISLNHEKEKRVTAAVSMRRKKKEESLKKRRLADASETKPANLTVESIPALHKQLYSNSEQEVGQALRAIRMLLCPADDQPTNVAQCLKAESSCIERICSFLQCNNSDMMVEAAWIVTNLIADDEECTREFVNNGVIPLLIQCTLHHDTKVATQSLWAIGNVCGDDVKYRDVVVGLNFIEMLVNKVNSGCSAVRELNVAVWVMHTICKESPMPPGAHQFIPILVNVLLKQPDEEILINAAHTLMALTGDPRCAAVAFELGVVPRLINLSYEAYTNLRRTVLRILGNLVQTSDQNITDQVINEGLLPTLHFVIQDQKHGVQREVLWILSNIAAGSKQNIQSLLQNALIPPIVQVLERGDNGCKKEAMWVISNILSNDCFVEEVLFLVDHGVLEPLCSIINPTKTTMENVELAIKTVDLFLAKGAVIAGRSGEVNKFSNIVIDCGGAQNIEDCRSHNNRNLADLAETVLEKYFNVEDEEANPFAQQGIEPTEEQLAAHRQQLEKQRQEQCHQLAVEGLQKEEAERLQALEQQQRAQQASTPQAGAPEGGVKSF